MSNMKIILVPVNQPINIIGNVYNDVDNVMNGRTAKFTESGQFVTSEIVHSGQTLCYVGLPASVVEKASVTCLLNAMNPHSQLLKSQRDILSKTKKSGKDEEKLKDIEAKLRQFVN